MIEWLNDWILIVYSKWNSQIDQPIDQSWMNEGMEIEIGCSCCYSAFTSWQELRVCFYLVLSLTCDISDIHSLLTIIITTLIRLPSNSNFNSLNLSFRNNDLSRLNNIFVESWTSVKWVLQHILYEILQRVDELVWKYGVDQHQLVRRRRSLHNTAV